MIASLFVVPILSALLQQQQPRLAGQITDSASRAAVPGVVVVDLATRRQALGDIAGRFQLDVAVPQRLRLSRVGYATREVAALTTDVAVQLAPSPRTLEGMTVTAFRGGSADEGAPVSQRTITRPEIVQRSFGQEMPLLLQGTPSITSYAETGNYWGYSYTRLRGIDQSRINLTIDGIPLNDPEDQVLYFADFPDLASSIESGRIRGGVGTSSAGTASFAASMNFEAAPLASRAGSQLQLEGGSF